MNKANNKLKETEKQATQPETKNKESKDETEHLENGKPQTHTKKTMTRQKWKAKRNGNTTITKQYTCLRYFWPSPWAGLLPSRNVSLWPNLGDFFSEPVVFQLAGCFPLWLAPECHAGSI